MNWSRRGYSKSMAMALLLICVLGTVISTMTAITLPHPPPSIHPSNASGTIEMVDVAAQSRVHGNISSLDLNPAGSEVAFSVVESHGGSQLWTVNAPGFDHFTKIATSSDYISDVKWSHDGNEILYLASTNRSATLFVVGLHDYQNKGVISSDGIQSASWSPNDSMIAFSGLTSTGWNVYVVNVRNWVVKMLTNNGGDEYTSWSPNGSSILISRCYGNESSILTTAPNQDSFQTLVNSSGTVIWPTENANGTLAFESNASGTWSVVTEVNGTLTDILSTSAYYTGISSPVADPSWGPIWASEGNQLFFIGRDLNSNRLSTYVVNFSGVVVAPSNLGMPADQEAYETETTYHLAVVSEVAGSSNLTLIASAWNEKEQTLFAIVPEKPSSFALVHVSPSNGEITYPNSYGSPSP